jgi:alpha-ketoglutarate-dependent taurine dioxygenase
MSTLVEITSVTALSPFGCVVHGDGATDPRSLDPAALAALATEHRVVVLRGFAPLPDLELVELCRPLGQVLEWEFGAINQLAPRDDARNYIYTRAAVPLHWDGAFVGRVPRFIVFHCDVAPDAAAGGETTFVDTTRVLAAATPGQRERWRGVSVTYETEKVVHYGGRFTARVVDRHPVTGEPVLRFAEPVEDLNPVRLTVTGAPDGAAFIDEMRSALASPTSLLVHRWQQGDLVIADNFALLHGRRAFTATTRRAIRRVNVL